MDNQGWIKLYRKIGDHEIIRDAYGLQIFIWILIHVDLTTGQYTSGRFVMSEALKIKPRTLHKVVTERLQNRYHLVTLLSDNKKTTFSICKWKSYQENSDTKSDTKVTPGGQQSDTKQEVRSKKILSKDNKAFGNANINYLIELFEGQYGYKPTDRKPRQEAWNLIRAIRSTFKDYGKEWSEEKEKVFIDKYFGWITKQEWASELQNMGTVRRKLPIYRSYLERSIHAQTQNGDRQN